MQEGLYTLIWGASTWDSLHSITFNYPQNPTKDDKKNYKKYFLALGKVLPCCICREHFKNHTENGNNALTDDVLKDRKSLTMWLYNLHKTVCEKNGMTFDITYEMVCDKYNSYIATCQLTQEQKQKAFTNYYDIHAPILEYGIVEIFIDRAKELGITNYEKNIKIYSDKNLDKKSEMWFNRNKNCMELIKKIRMNGMLNLDENNLPNYDELSLMQYCSTTISKHQWNRVLKQMGCFKCTKYVLINNKN